MISRANRNKVDNQSLDELEFQYSNDLDQFVKTIAKKYAEKTDMKKLLKNIDR